MKTLKKSQLKTSYREKSTTAYRLMQNQITLLKKLSHENILKLTEVVMDSTSDSIFMVHEYESCVSLWNIFEKGNRIDVRDARRYFRKLISALQYCHEIAGIIHRGIRLENIMISENPDWMKLIETGQSFMVEKEELEDTIQYNPPELLKDSIYKNAQSDIWAFGVCLYYMVEGCFPFTGATSEIIKLSIQNLKISFKIATDPDLKDLIDRMLTKIPSKRITLEQILVYSIMLPL